MDKNFGFSGDVITKKTPELTSEKTLETPGVSLDELNEILEIGESVLQNALKMGGEIDEIIENRQKALDDFRKIEDEYKSSLNKIEEPSTEGFSSNDYERLEQEGILEKDQIEKMQKLNEMISRFESIKYPSAKVSSQLKTFLGLRGILLSQIQKKIEERQEVKSEQQNEIRQEIVNHYIQEAERLTDIISQFESNPEVLDRLHSMAEKEYQEYQKERVEMIEEVARCIQSLGSRHSNSFERIRLCLKDESFYGNLKEAFENNDQKKLKSLCDSLRNRLIKNILEEIGEKQIKEPKEIIPWRVNTASIRYGDAYDFLSSQEIRKTLEDLAKKGDEKSQNYLDQIDQIKMENAILRRIIGPNQILSAFDKRKENDAKGLTEELLKRKKMAKEKEENISKEIEALVAKGGFIVESPVVESVKGKLRQIGTAKGAVLLEKKKSKKNNDIWEVVEIVGKVNGLKVGRTSLLDMSDFPNYVREAAKAKFEI